MTFDFSNSRWIDLYHPTGKLWMNVSEDKGFTFKITGLPDIESNIIEIAARSLSMTNRFGGQTSMPFSVLRHSLYIGLCLKYREWSNRIIFCGLMHDISEAFFTDVPKPFKIQDDTKRELAIFKCLPWVELHGDDPHSGAVKYWDNVALVMESEKYGYPTWELSRVVKAKYNLHDSDLQFYRNIMNLYSDSPDDVIQSQWIEMVYNVKSSL